MFVDPCSSTSLPVLLPSILSTWEQLSILFQRSPFLKCVFPYCEVRNVAFKKIDLDTRPPTKRERKITMKSTSNSNAFMKERQSSSRLTSIAQFDVINSLSLKKHIAVELRYFTFGSTGCPLKGLTKDIFSSGTSFI